jgi:hypothetical protein
VSANSAHARAVWQSGDPYEDDADDCFAQTPAIRRRLGERVKSTLSGCSGSAVGTGAKGEEADFG